MEGRVEVCTDQQLLELVWNFTSAVTQVDPKTSLLERYADADSRLDCFDAVNAEMGDRNPWFSLNVVTFCGALVRRLVTDSATASSMDAIAVFALACRLATYIGFLHRDSSSKDVVQEAVAAVLGALVRRYKTRTGSFGSCATRLSFSFVSTLRCFLHAPYPPSSGLL